jgi:membrane protein required for colicin V production
MVIDILFLVLIIFAIYQGLTKGLILGIFSFLGFVIGIVAAIKLSAVVATHLKGDNDGFNRWLPVISFLLVFIVVIILVSLLGKLTKKIAKVAMLGWLDSLLGLILYVVLYTIIFSIFLFFAEKIGAVSAQTITASRLYPYVHSWGPSLIDNIGNIIPAFKNMFTDLGNFFEGVVKK